MKKVQLILAGIILLAMVPLATLAAPAHAATRLGGVSMYNACQRQWPGSNVALIAPYNVMDWKCAFNGSLGASFMGINVNLQCKQQYNNSNAYAAYSDFNNAYSWSCYV